MDFSFDPRKSVLNARKHGIDFEDAQALWDDPDLVEAAARILDEQRRIVIGKLDGKHWVAVVTYRGQRTGIISVRRARKEEIALYEG